MSNLKKFSISDVYYFEHGSKNEYKVSWKMTNFCPYNCSYCYMSDAVSAAKAKDDNPTQEFVEYEAIMLNKYIKSHIAENRKIVLHLIGGEVSIFNLIKILDKIDNIYKVIIATNLYRDYEYYNELENYAKIRNFKIILIASFHLEMLNTEDLRWDFIKKVEKLNAQIKAVLNPQNLDTYKPYFEYAMQNLIRIELTISRNYENRFNFNGFTKEQWEYIDYIRRYETLFIRNYYYYRVHFKDGTYEDYTSNISMLNSCKEGILDLTGFYCDAGINGVRLNQKGDLLRAACRLCSMYMKLGTITDENSWPSKEEICPFICTCFYKKKIKQGKSPYQGCTCFNNTEMWDSSYDRETNKFAYKKICIPDYDTIYKESRQLKDVKLH